MPEKRWNFHHFLAVMIPAHTVSRVGIDEETKDLS
jgi:hypothetical protein